MTNQEWLCSLSAEDFLNRIKWLLQNYGKRWTDSDPAIIEWLQGEHAANTPEDKEMTNEEAKDIIEKYLALDSEVDSEYIQAQKVAVEALKQEQCEDCISRQAVVNGIANTQFWLSASNWEELMKVITDLPSVTPVQKWIPVSERLPETDNENSINNYNVLLWVKDKSHPEREPQVYLGKLRHVDGDDGSRNFWGIETKPCDWTIWGWSYFWEPEVIAWMPLPQPYKTESEE